MVLEYLTNVYEAIMLRRRVMLQMNTPDTPCDGIQHSMFPPILWGEIELAIWEIELFSPHMGGKFFQDLGIEIHNFLYLLSSTISVKCLDTIILRKGVKENLFKQI